MLDRLRERATQILAATQLCTLATTGPAGIQASMTPCVAQGTTLYLLAPDTSEHLFNLEVAPEVAVTTEHWHLHGTAVITQEGAALFAAEQRQWHTAIRVTPLRLHILPDSDMGTHAETIDFDPELS
ncbi:MAG: hypothetical protein DYG89_45215 [Caldilinea sp. CFX5]|nr:hypothetical protein [Caldilinea sp. CFX5]